MGRKVGTGALAFPRPARRMHDKAYLAKVHDLPCYLSGADCAGPIEADHMGERLSGRKADDTTVVPLCKLHHAQRHHGARIFRTMTKLEMRAWKQRAIADTQRRIREAA